MGIPDSYNDLDSYSPEVGQGLESTNYKKVICKKCGKSIEVFYGDMLCIDCWIGDNNV